MVQEIRSFCENNDIELIIFDRELTPSQIKAIARQIEKQFLPRLLEDLTSLEK